MSTRLNSLYKRFIRSFGIDEFAIPATAVKFFTKNESIPREILENHPDEITLTSCQAAKQALLGDAALLTLENIGCVAAAISLGLVDQNYSHPIGESRVYTDIMRQQSGLGERFVPPTPKDFTDGLVYACHDANRPDFCLFGKEDCGRFKDVETARRAVRDMVAIQPATMKAVFFYSPDYAEAAFEPDVVVLSLRPVELSRVVQAYQYATGKRVTATMGAVRVVNSDLVVRPFLMQEINISVYCVGSRLIAQFGPNRMGMGMPFRLFGTIVTAMEQSGTGYPFHLYPGAVEGSDSDI